MPTGHPDLAHDQRNYEEVEISKITDKVNRRQMGLGGHFLVKTSREQNVSLFLINLHACDPHKQDSAPRVPSRLKHLKIRGTSTEGISYQPSGRIRDINTYNFNSYV